MVSPASTGRPAPDPAPPDLRDLRARFRSLARIGPGGRPFAFFDGPAGTQVPDGVVQAVTDYYARACANTHGRFETSRRSQAVVEAARRAMADLLVAEPDEIAFGPNMTTLTFAVSRALGRHWSAGDEVIVSRLDHDANIAPWRALEERGVVVRELEFDPRDCTLVLDRLGELLGKRTRLVAVGHASNSVGTLNPVAEIARMTHEVGALLWVDAVHSAPHVPIDVHALGADFLVCSVYKFFGPHVGVLWGRREVLETLTAYKARPAPDTVPDKFETGTQSFEGLAGTVAAVDYLAGIGRRSDACEAGVFERLAGRRLDLKRALATIAAWERPMAARLIEGLQAIEGARVFGITAPERISERCPTVAFRLAGKAPAEVAQRLADQGIFVWDGNQYALCVTETLGIENSGGFVRAGIVHYNTPEEVERLLGAVRMIAGTRAGGSASGVPADELAHPQHR